MGTGHETNVKLLLDVHVLVWSATGDSRLTSTVRAALVDSNNALFFSAISCWEYSGLLHSKRLPIDTVLDELLSRSFVNPLDFPANTHCHAMTLPEIHQDPFDRMLIAHALASSLTLVTADTIIHQYPVPIFWGGT